MARLSFKRAGNIRWRCGLAVAKSAGEEIQKRGYGEGRNVRDTTRSGVLVVLTFRLACDVGDDGGSNSAKYSMKPSKCNMGKTISHCR